MGRNKEFYQRMADLAAEQQNNDFRNGWNEAMEAVMQYDKPWSDPWHEPPGAPDAS